MSKQEKPKRKIGCLSIVGGIIGLAIIIGIISSISGGDKNKGNLVDNTTTNNNSQTLTQNQETQNKETQSQETQNQETQNQGTQNQETQKENKPKIEFGNTTLQNQVGITLVIGEAKNNDSKAHTFTLKVSFYDKDKKLLGTAVGAVNELNGGETKVFSAMATEDYTNADSYKVQLDTMLSSTNNKMAVVEFSNIITKNQAGITFVDGEAKNTDTKDHSFTLVIGFYDKDKKLIGTATGAVNELAAGDTKTFSAISAGDYSKAASFKVQVDTMLQ